MNIDKNKILNRLLRQYKQGDITELDLKNILVELEIMEPTRVVTTRKISSAQMSNMHKDGIVIIK